MQTDRGRTATATAAHGVKTSGDYEIKYFVDGDDLILIYPSEVLLDAFRADEDFTDEDVVLFRGIFARIPIFASSSSAGR